MDFPGDSAGEESACKVGDQGLIPGEEDPLEKREWQPTPAFLPGESHGQRSLAGSRPRGLQELDMTEQLTIHFHLTSKPQRECYCGALRCWPESHMKGEF